MKTSDMRDEITLWLETQVPDIANNIGEWAGGFLNQPSTETLDLHDLDRRWFMHFPAQGSEALDKWIGGQGDFARKYSTVVSWRLRRFKTHQMTTMAKNMISTGGPQPVMHG